MLFLPEHLDIFGLPIEKCVCKTLARGIRSSSTKGGLCLALSLRFISSGTADGQQGPSVCGAGLDNFWLSNICHVRVRRAQVFAESAVLMAVALISTEQPMEQSATKERLVPMAMVSGRHAWLPHLVSAMLREDPKPDWAIKQFAPNTEHQPRGTESSRVRVCTCIQYLSQQRSSTPSVPCQKSPKTLPHMWQRENMTSTPRFQS